MIPHLPHLFLIQHVGPVNPWFHLYILHLLIQVPVDGAVLRPAVMEVADTEDQKEGDEMILTF